MKPFLYIISVFWLVIGVLFLLFPQRSKTLYTKLVKPTKTLFLSPIIAGVLFLWAAPSSSLEGFIKLLGIISLLKGLFILISPMKVLSSTLNYFLGRSLAWWRVYGVFIVLLGEVVVWSIR